MAAKTIRVQYVFVTLLVILLIYACFLIPFTLPKSFHGNEDFVIVSTIAAILLTLFSVTGNGLICFTLSCGNNVNRPLNFLVVSMAIADMLAPLFHYPITLSIRWVSKEQLWTQINIGDLFDSIKYFRCVSFGLSSLSILSVTMISLLQFYQVLRKQNKVPTVLKVFSCLVTLSLSVVTAIMIYNYFDEEWSHAFLATMTFYIPMVLMFALMITSYKLTERSTTYSEENSDRQQFLYALFLSYLILWLPWYSVQTLHKYCCHLDYYHLLKARFFTLNLLMVKGCFNIMLLAYFDKRFQYTVSKMIKRTCFCYQRTSNLQFADDRDFSIRYSAGENDVIMDLDDERYLIA